MVDFVCYSLSIAICRFHVGGNNLIPSPQVCNVEQVVIGQRIWLYAKFR